MAELAQPGCATISDVPKLTPEQEALVAEQERTTRLHARAKKAHDEASAASLAAAIASLRGDVPPTVVAKASPFTAAYIRREARKAGIEGDPKYDRTSGR